jgi:transposase
MKVYIGIDWSKDKHDIAFMHQNGEVLAYLTVAAIPKGFESFDTQRRRMGIAVGECLVGIETDHNLFVDYLLSQGYEQIYILPPLLVKESRQRFSSSGANTDRSDGRLIADILRTDHGRLHVYQPDSPLTQQIAGLCSLQRFLTHSVIQLTNRLRNVLWRYYPNATQVFSALDKQIALEFIRTYPTPQMAQQLSIAEFNSFAKQQGYTQPSKLPACYARLQQSQPFVHPSTVQAYCSEAVRLAELSLMMVQHRTLTEKELLTLFKKHPDAAIFASLPGAGNILAPALLAKFGDDRLRFPSSQSLQAVAGTCPVTKASGKSKYVAFRRACDLEFRWIVQQWARASLDRSVWANTYFRSVRPRCRSNSHAYRCLANRWLEIAWRIWQDRIPYDEQLHLRQHAARVLPK